MDSGRPLAVELPVASNVATLRLGDVARGRRPRDERASYEEEFFAQAIDWSLADQP